MIHASPTPPGATAFREQLHTEAVTSLPRSMPRRVHSLAIPTARTTAR